MRVPSRIAMAVACIVLAGNAWAGTGEDLIASRKCGRCHTAKTTKKAPSFAAVAEKYKGQADAAARLLETLRTGGADDHDKVVASDAELQAIVAAVLASK